MIRTLEMPLTLRPHEPLANHHGARLLLCVQQHNPSSQLPHRRSGNVCLVWPRVQECDYSTGHQTGTTMDEDVEPSTHSATVLWSFGPLGSSTWQRDNR
jgi:hypothetical protein